MATINATHDEKHRKLQAAGTPTTKNETAQEAYLRLNAASTLNLTEDRKRAIEVAAGV